MLVKKRTAKLCAGLLVATVILSGCSLDRRRNAADKIEDLTDSGVINYETSPLGIDSTKKGFEEQLVSNRFYVVHDGLYYSTNAGYVDSTFEEGAENYVDKSRQMYYTTASEIKIPTLFEGDKLVYYSEDNLLGYITWERFKDVGYTIGLHDMQSMINGRQYVTIDDDHNPIIEGGELADMAELGVDNILIDKIGGIQITEEMIEDGLLMETKKSKSYDLEVYTGTHYKHYNATANIHAFVAYELFASIEYETLQDRFYEIEIPEYFVDGYYSPNALGLFRLVRGDSYSEETDFNEQLLFPYVDVNAYNYDLNRYIAPYIYSTFPPLNKFTTNQEGTLGYEEVSVVQGTLDETTVGGVVLKEATIKTVDLWLPAGKECTVRIKSSAKESTGDVQLKSDRLGIKFGPYNRIDDVYEIVVPGKGEKAELMVSGLWKSYDIELVNAEQYNGQDAEDASVRRTGDTEEDDTEGQPLEEETSGSSDETEGNESPGESDPTETESEG